MTKHCIYFLLANTHNFLFERKHIVIEELVQLFICVINAKLLKRIYVKVLEAKNIQYTKESVSFK